MVDRATRERWDREDLLAPIRDGWNEAATTDPMFNILTHPGKEGQWDRNEFFATGRREIERVLAELDLTDFGSALDFGCGIGRLTAALEEHFDSVTGVDLSAEMLTQAKENVPAADFQQVESTNLAMFEDRQFDFAYTHIVLQHMPVELQEVFVKELCRVASVAMFDTIEGPNNPHPWIGMHTVNRETVEEWIPAPARVIVTEEELWTRNFFVVNNG